MSGSTRENLSGVWGDVPSADIEETRRASTRATKAPPAPLVNVGQVHGNVITINAPAGLDIAALLARPLKGGTV